MNINKLAYFLLAITFVIASCEKDEPTIKLPARGNTSFIVIDSLGKDFEKQAFFNLKDSQITLVNINSWDLAFEASPFGYNITINGGMDMYAAKVNSRKFIKSSKPDTFNYKWDSPCGCYDSLAINRWLDDDKIFILDRGGYYKTDRYFQIKFTDVNANNYKFEYATLDNPYAVTSVILAKDYTKQNVYYSFTTPTTYINFEPQKEDWDFCFLKYRYVFYENNPIVKYVVRGIFINTTKNAVAIDSTISFENITPTFAQNNLHYSNMRDVMGYDWKVYNFTIGQYVARTKVNYIIRDYHSHETYKLRFLDFNNNGIKGTPKFEYLLLK